MSRTSPSQKITTIDDLFNNSSRKLVIHKNDRNIIKQTQIKIRKTPVSWGIPMDEVLFSLWFSNYVHLPTMPWDNFIITLSTYLAEARNTIHNAFLDMEGCDYLVMLDSDVLPPPDFLERLMAHKKDMVGGWYKRKTGNCSPVVYDYKHNDGLNDWYQRQEPGHGLERVDGAGAGCWLMTRKIVKALGESPYNMNRGGEDFELCRKVTELGFEMFIDWDINCAHAGVGLI